MKAEVAQPVVEEKDPPPLSEVEYPKHNTELIMHVEIFTTNSHAIGPQQQQILDALADNVNRCEN